ncbi:hypothetical protein EKO27_g10961 [Xylaria grammica]|uniref:Heterokaryon incompatibility domain-containing protein n=1 Tax=Xylaria grammica TaxID=363999 RepID=A0A439CPR8_9PEZI|nr:hypothetical protein EKO27_g10961 [Xylaria grammica]
MRLINTRSLDLEEFVGSAIPKYAILSHTWEEGEVTFQEWHDRDTAARKPGYRKIVAACIDKKSSAELSEAINSMFAWYANSDRCYVYFADLLQHTLSTGTAKSTVISGPVSTNELRKCRWFTRGWTLQELLAPKTVIFFDSNWRQCGNKYDEGFRAQISEVTLIDTKYFRNRHQIFAASVSARMSWVAHRETTREEDIAYCMLGIFGINMPLLYGEGRGAFLRLQEEIIRISNDQTIFCWSYPNAAKVDDNWDSVLAPHPRVFSASGKYTPDPNISTSYSLTNHGLEITLLADRINDTYSLVLLGAVTLYGGGLALILHESGSLQARGARDRLRCLPSPHSYDVCQINSNLSQKQVPSRRFRLKYRATPAWAKSVMRRPLRLRRLQPSLVLLPIGDIDFRVYPGAHKPTEGWSKPRMNSRQSLEVGTRSIALSTDYINSPDDKTMFTIRVSGGQYGPEYKIFTKPAKSAEEILDALKTWLDSRKRSLGIILPPDYPSVIDPGKGDIFILAGRPL